MYSAPVQDQMSSGNPIAGAKNGLFIKQEFEIFEFLSGCETRNKYRVGELRDDGKMGASLGLIREDSQCLERMFCGPNRRLKLNFKANATDKNDPTTLVMDKSFGCFCFEPCQSSMNVQRVTGEQVGRVQANCVVCCIDAKVYDKDGENKYSVKAPCCQCGLMCPCCANAEYPIYDREHREAGKITKTFNGCSELCAGINTYSTTFPPDLSVEDKELFMASTMLIDFGYFEQKS
jgi:hypothetical protein